MRKLFLISIVALLITSCGGSDGDRKIIADLPFHTATDAKSYSDIILKCIRTNRVKPLYAEFEDKNAVEIAHLKRLVAMYSTGMTGRDDWEEFDIYDLSKKKKNDSSSGYDYAWLEPKGRLGLQINILPAATPSGRFCLKKIEFRSRLDVIESYAFPGGEIDNYRKLDFNW